MHITLNDVKNNIKWFFQRRFRGYDDRALWDIGTYTLECIYKPFKAYVKNNAERGISLPNDFATDPNAWMNVLNKIQFSFDYYWNDQHGDYEYVKKTSEEIRAENAKVQEGLELFGKYMMEMWN